MYYILIYEWNNDGEYEDYRSETNILGVFSSKEKALEIAKRRYDKTKKAYEKTVEEGFYMGVESDITDYRIKESGNKTCLSFSYGSTYEERYHDTYIIRPIEIDKMIE